MVDEPAGGKLGEGGVRGGRGVPGRAAMFFRQFSNSIQKVPWPITGSELCFSIMSELLVDGAAADKLGEGGVRGGRGGSRVSPDRAQKVPWRMTGSAASTLVVSRRSEF